MGDESRAVMPEAVRVSSRNAGRSAGLARNMAQLRRLTADLQRSRERLVTTREEERRRLRRKLQGGRGAPRSAL